MSSPELQSLELADRLLAVRWSNGEISRFHHIWLRDNCTCSQCGTTATGRRLLRLIDIPEDVSPERAELDDGSLAIRWRPDGHQSRYRAEWLREHCYSNGAAGSRANLRRPWGAEITENLIYRSYPSVRDSEEERLQLVEQIYRDGLALLSDVEPEREAFEEMAELIGPIKGYSYEPVSEIKVEPEAPLPATHPHGHRIAYSGGGLTPHVDESFRGTQPGLVVLQCVAAAAQGGGESVLVDGFKIAERLREQEPEAFDLLCGTAVGFRRAHEGFDHYTEAPVFTLDSNREVVRFCFAEKSAAPVRAPEHMIEPIYAARRALLTLAHDESLQAKFALRPGDALIVDNYRLMHGRTSYQGARHLRHCHIDRDEMFSRYRMACRRLGRIPAHS